MAKTDLPEGPLREAATVVYGDRADLYGHPIDNHGCTAAMWTAFLERRGILAEGAKVTARDVCMLNILQKCSRDANQSKADNLVDVCGYAANADMLLRDAPAAEGR